MSKGMLVDTTRCIGCRACQVACKRWNAKPVEDTWVTETGTNPPKLSSKTWTLVDIRQPQQTDDAMTWSFVKRQCMHCIDPACVSACPVGALTKLDNGPVIYRAERCFGCRYCMIACPFQIPKFEWDSNRPTIQKCEFCADRLANDIEPACAGTCPTQAIAFGEREELLHEAKARIYNASGKYVPHIFGENEAGGTSWMYIYDASLEQLGLPANLEMEPYPEFTKGFLLGVPLV
ncbi:MAG: Ni/Fe hydrogenase, partial [Dehalococcoidia bacterium]|nr:Ni/Fe hydrogenase [Dehalococcoidia bacterium]